MKAGGRPPQDHSGPLAKMLWELAEQSAAPIYPGVNDWNCFWEAARGIFADDPDLKRCSRRVRTTVMRAPAITAFARAALRDEIVRSAEGVMCGFRFRPISNNRGAVAEITSLRLSAACVIVSVCGCASIEPSTLKEATLQLREMWSDVGMLNDKEHGGRWRHSKRHGPHHTTMVTRMRKEASEWRAANPGKPKASGYRRLIALAKREGLKTFKNAEFLRSWMNRNGIPL